MDRQAASRTGAVAEGGAMTAPSPARFSAEDRAVLLAVKGVGPTVLERLETLGIASMAALACQGADEVCRRIAAMLGASCWSNSPMARGANDRGIDAAKIGRRARWATRWQVVVIWVVSGYGKTKKKTN